MHFLLQYAVIIVVITVLELAFGIFIFAYSGQLVSRLGNRVCYVCHALIIVVQSFFIVLNQ